MTSEESLARWVLSEYRYRGGTDRAVIQQLEKEAKEAAMNETQQETWNATHAQLLKSVADAQARLLAGINEISDATAHMNGFLTGWQARVDAQSKDLKVMVDKLSEYSTHNLEVAEKRINGRLDAIGAILAELLTVRRPGPRPTKRRRKR